MSQLTDNLYSIDAIKSGIRSAIEEKGVDMTGLSFQDYPAAIGSITTSFVTTTLSTSVNGTFTPGVGVDGYSQVVVDVPQSVTGFTEKEITERRYSIISLNNSASIVASYAFMDNSYLQTVSLYNCWRISNQAFNGCQNLSYVDIPSCTTVAAAAFYNCYNLQTINMQHLWHAEAEAFRNCSTLTELNLSELRYVSSSAFQGCKALSSIKLPMCSFINSNGFAYCSSLTELYLPLCTSVSSSAFTGCYGLTQINLPLLIAMRSEAFSNCSSLTSLSLPILMYSNNGRFNQSPLSDVTLGGTYYVAEYFSLGSYFVNNNGVIKVDATVYNDWINATGWTSLSSYFTSYGDVNEPMLSLSNGVLSGKTMCLTGQKSFSWSTYVQLASTSDVNMVDLSQCKYIYNSALYSMQNLSIISLPTCDYLGYYAISGCYHIEHLYIPNCKRIDSYALQNNVIGSITLGGSSVCVLMEQNYLYSTNSIYVPASLVDAYKSATNWNGVASKIFAIPE